jgi:hypothetical protein
LQVEVGVIFELSDQKARGFLVLIALTWLFSEYTHKVFGEIFVRIYTNFWSNFYRHSLAYVLTSIDSYFHCDSRFPNPILRATSLSITT